jgi:hypothetical protein
MKCSVAIERLTRILEREGDIDIELPGGTLLHRLDVVTVSPNWAQTVLNAGAVRGTANETGAAQKLPPDGQKKR